MQRNTDSRFKFRRETLNIRPRHVAAGAFGHGPELNVNNLFALFLQSREMRRNQCRDRRIVGNIRADRFEPDAVKVSPPAPPEAETVIVSPRKGVTGGSFGTGTPGLA